MSVLNGGLERVICNTGYQCSWQLILTSDIVVKLLTLQMHYINSDTVSNQNRLTKSTLDLMHDKFWMLKILKDGHLTLDPESRPLLELAFD